MATSRDTDTAPPPQTVLATVRVPNDGALDLVADVERRLRGVDCVRAVAVDAVRGVDPRLSATHLTATVTVRTDHPVATAELCDCLVAGSGVETVEPPDNP